MHAKGEYINGISETTVVGEFAFDLGMIDPKVDLARVRLAVGHTAMAVDPQMESSSLLGIVATDQIPEGIPEIVVDLCPQRDRERLLAELQFASIGHFHEGLTAIEAGSDVRLGRFFIRREVQSGGSRLEIRWRHIAGMIDQWPVPNELRLGSLLAACHRADPESDRQEGQPGEKQRSSFGCRSLDLLSHHPRAPKFVFEWS